MFNVKKIMNVVNKVMEKVEVVMSKMESGMDKLLMKLFGKGGSKVVKVVDVFSLNVMGGGLGLMCVGSLGMMFGDVNGLSLSMWVMGLMVVWVGLGLECLVGMFNWMKLEWMRGEFGLVG